MWHHCCPGSHPKSKITCQHEHYSLKGVCHPFRFYLSFMGPSNVQVMNSGLLHLEKSTLAARKFLTLWASFCDFFFPGKVDIGVWNIWSVGALGLKNIPFIQASQGSCVENRRVLRGLETRKKLQGSAFPFPGASSLDCSLSSKSHTSLLLPQGLCTCLTLCLEDFATSALFKPSYPRSPCLAQKSRGFS